MQDLENSLSFLELVFFEAHGGRPREALHVERVKGQHLRGGFGNVHEENEANQSFC